MAKYIKSQSHLSIKSKKINKDNSIHNDSDDDTLSSSYSKLSIDPNQSLVNNIGHNLFLSAIKQKREERLQAKRRQKTKIQSKIIPQQTIKKKLTNSDIDRVFEEKRLRPQTIKNDLFNLYQNSTSRIRSMLDIRQIDQFIQTTQNRNINQNI